MRERARILLMAAAFAVASTGCVEADDDDSAAVGCVVDDSGGSGGAVGVSWHPVPGWGDAGTEAPDHEVYVYRAAGLSGAAPLAILTSNPVSASRADIEELMSGVFVPWAEAYGYLLAFPVGGGVEGGTLGFRSGQDGPYLGDALDVIEAAFSIDRSSVHLFGRSGGARLGIELANEHSTRVASIMSLAGPQPFSTWPAWERPVAGLFVHDPADPIVGRATVQDTVNMFLDAGAEVETFFDYSGGHDWKSDEVEPRMAAFFDRTCLE